MSTSDHNLVSLNIVFPGGIPGGDWETITGREMTAEGDKYRPGPGQNAVAMGGPISYSDITITRTYLDDQVATVKLLRQVGSKATGTITETPLDQDYAPFGDKTTWQVRLQGVKVSDTDINSGAKRTLELTFWVTGSPS
jgi:hypothetical protein